MIQFGRDLGIQPATFPEFLELERAQLLATTDDDTFESRVAAVRLIVSLTPSADQGVGIKTQLRTTLEGAVEGMSSEEFLMLRNLDISGFPDPQSFWEAISKWLGAHNFPSVDDPTMQTALSDAGQIPNAVEAWKSAVWAGIGASVQRDRSPFSAAFWRWISDDVTLIDILMDRLDLHPGLDTALADAVPRKLEDTVAHKVLSRMACTQWRHSHAAAAAAAFEPREAVRRQLDFDSEGADDAPLRRAIRKARPNQLIALAMEFADSRIIALAVAATAIKPALLVRVDVNTEIGQKIWSGALDINEEAWSGPAEPQDALYLLLESLLAGRPVISPLLLALSRSPLADLSKFSNRDLIWVCLEGDALNRFLAATADAWLESLAEGAHTPVPESELERSILEPARLDPFLDKSVTQNVVHGTKLFSALPNVPEDRFVIWLEQVLGRHNVLPGATIEHLGRMLIARNWSKALDVLVREFRNGRSDLLPALRICSSLLSILDRYLFRITPLNKADKQDLFMNIAVKLYPDGPDQDELWERAGGRNSDLDKQGTGSAKWTAALRKMFNGQDPEPDKLLNVMLEDFPRNDQLSFLADDREFRGSRY